MSFEPPSANHFLNLPAEQAAALVRQRGPIVCAFPINGTRRWFILEKPPQKEDNPASVYLHTMFDHHAALYRLFFDHGIDTMLAPVFGPDPSERGVDYNELAAQGLAGLATYSGFLNFYYEYGVRVRFYGDYRRYFASTPYAYLNDLFDSLMARTADHNRCRLFFGVCANDAAETTAELAIQYHSKHGRAPDKRALVEAYYGEYVPPLNFLIGFDKFCMFDVPLLTTGNEDLYFTVSPSLYLNERQLREILFDHLYTRRADETDYADVSPMDWELMRRFYQANQGNTMGVGAWQTNGGYWYPLPQVKLPKDFHQG